MIAWNYSAVLDRFAAVPDRFRNGFWKAHCPAHDDRSPSLRLWLGHDTKIMLSCYASCPKPAIIGAVGLKWSDLFPPREGTTPMNGREIVAVYPYRDEHGALVYEAVRYHPKDFRQRRPDGTGGCIWNLDGILRVPYRLPELIARAEQPICVTEGEKSCEYLRKLGFVATTNAGGAGKWEPHFGRWLARRRVAIFPDSDNAGEMHGLLVAASALAWRAESIRVVQLPDVPEHAGVDDWLLMQRGDKRAALIDLIKQYPEWVQR